jgi:hypothetical protein
MKRSKIDELIKSALAESIKSNPELPSYISSHEDGICEKTGKRYIPLEGQYKNTIGKDGPYSGWVGREITCSQCGDAIGRTVDMVS